MQMEKVSNLRLKKRKLQRLHTLQLELRYKGYHHQKNASRNGYRGKNSTVRNRGYLTKGNWWHKHTTYDAMNKIVVKW